MPKRKTFQLQIWRRFSEVSKKCEGKTGKKKKRRKEKERRMEGKKLRRDDSEADTGRGRNDLNENGGIKKCRIGKCRRRERLRGKVPEKRKKPDGGNRKKENEKAQEK